MRPVDTDTLATRSKEDVLRRNEISESVFEAEAPMLAKPATRCPGYAPDKMSSMTTVTVDDIQKDPLGYLRRVEAGETIVVVREDGPFAEIRPVASSAGAVRPAGLCAGEFVVPDDFDDPLPEDVLDRFEGR